MFERIEPAKSYEEYLPEQFRPLLEIKALAGIIDLDMKDYYEKLRQFTDNRFVQTLDLETVKRWEAIFDLTSPIKDDLQSRRQSIQAKLLSQPPINIATLKKITEAYLGVEVNVESHVEPYVLRITYRGLEELPDLQPYMQSIYRTIPANIKIILEYAYQTWKSVGLKTWDAVGRKTWHEIHYDL